MAVQYTLLFALVLASVHSSKSNHHSDLESWFSQPHFYYHYQQYYRHVGATRRSDLGDDAIVFSDQRPIPDSHKFHLTQEQERRRKEPPQRTKHPARTGNNSKIINNPPLGFNEKFHIAQTREGIVFPGSTSNRRYTPNEIPEKCKVEGFCEEIPDYPEELVNSLVSTLDRRMFHTESLDAVEIRHRIGNPDEEELCSFREKVIAPRAAPDSQGKWYYVINAPGSSHIQTFRVEVCSRAEGPCANFVNFPVTYRSYCKQKFNMINMSVLNDGGNVENKQLKIPTCCKCVVKKKD